MHVNKVVATGKVEAVGFTSSADIALTAGAVVLKDGLRDASVTTAVRLGDATHTSLPNSVLKSANQAKTTLAAKQPLVYDIVESAAAILARTDLNNVGKTAIATDTKKIYVGATLDGQLVWNSMYATPASFLKHFDLTGPTSTGDLLKVANATASRLLEPMQVTASGTLGTTDYILNSSSYAFHMLSDNTFIFACATSSGVIINTGSVSDLTVTFNTPQVVASSISIKSFVLLGSHFFIDYMDTSYTSKFVAGSVDSELAITLGPVLTYHYVAGYGSDATAVDSSTVLVVGVKTPSTGEIYFAAYSINSENVISLKIAVTTITLGVTINSNYITIIGSNGEFIYGDSNSNTPTLYYFGHVTVTDTEIIHRGINSLSITFGAHLFIISSSLVSIVYLLFNGTSYYLNVALISYTGTGPCTILDTISIDTQIYSYDYNYFNCSSVTFTYANTKYVAFTYAMNRIMRIKFCEYSDTSISLVNTVDNLLTGLYREKSYSSLKNNFALMVPSTSTLFLFNENSSNYGVYNCFRLAKPPLNFTKFAGVLQSSQDVMLRKGISTAHSNLTPGRKYFLQNDGSISTTPSTYLVGIALAADQLLLF